MKILVAVLVVYVCMCVLNREQVFLKKTILKF